MRLFTPFTIPQKENCDLCRVEKNKEKAVENHLLDNLFRNLLGIGLISFLTDVQLLIGDCGLFENTKFYSYRRKRKWHLVQSPFSD
tara:strand:- start:286 stop:543 length:258 start_codon:yes stop_codon:yes gene_type:complete